MANFLTRLLGGPDDGPNIREALSIINQDRIKNRQKRISDDYNISPVTTSRGTTDSWGQLQDMFRQAQYQRQNDLDSMPTQQELDYGQPPPQQGAFIPMPDSQVLGTSGVGIPAPIRDYATSYRYSPAGEYGTSRLDEQNLSILWDSINSNYPDLDPQTKERLLANLVAVAQAESGMGGAYGNPEAGNYKDSNYWNWFAGGDRNFDPQSFNEMADIITKGIGGYTLGTGGRFTRDNASTYTGNDNLSYWYDDIYNPAMNAMGY